MLEPLHPREYRDLVRRAVVEDIGPGDLTTLATVPAGAVGRAKLLARRACVVAGLDIVQAVFAEIDPRVEFTALTRDGETCGAGETMAMLAGPASALLVGERTALNFLQHLSGIATQTRRFVEAAGEHLTVLDTRKTLPTLRAIEKYAVRCGGAVNHRAGLYDAVLIKDNHIRLAGGVGAAVRRAREYRPGAPIEVEAQSLDEVGQALAARVDTIMLDNLSDDEMREAVAIVNGRAHIEISGGVTLDRIRALASIGADSVSVGALTHSAPAADISLEIE
jgi:nicotinate-nucleotide pyrophosphorylase (carboxylating)